jgi:hypothetical protein
MIRNGYHAAGIFRDIDGLYGNGLATFGYIRCDAIQTGGLTQIP